jgi:hypothetical protein
VGSVTVRATNGGHYEVFFGFGASKMANSTSENACFFSMFVTTVFKRSKRRPFATPSKRLHIPVSVPPRWVKMGGLARRS